MCQIVNVTNNKKSKHFFFLETNTHTEEEGNEF